MPSGAHCRNGTVKSWLASAVILSSATFPTDGGTAAPLPVEGTWSPHVLQETGGEKG